MVVDYDWSEDFKAKFRASLSAIQANINRLSREMNIANEELAKLEECQKIKLRTKNNRIKKKQQAKQMEIINNSRVLDKFYPFELSRFIDKRRTSN